MSACLNRRVNGPSLSDSTGALRPHVLSRRLEAVQLAVAVGRSRRSLRSLSRPPLDGCIVGRSDVHMNRILRVVSAVGFAAFATWFVVCTLAPQWLERRARDY